MNALQPVKPVLLPGGHYAHSVATSNNAILALVNDNGTGQGEIGHSELLGAHRQQTAQLGNLPEPARSHLRSGGFAQRKQYPGWPIRAVR
ncbi:MAG: hypothetical protein WDO73_13365 [Ignavibacteriota bacterium]